MDYEFEDPAVQQELVVEDSGDNGMENEGQENDNMMEEEEDIPVTQEDAWAVIRSVD
jgi:hypothetical protein